MFGRGVSWTHGTIKDLGSLSGGREKSMPNAINDWGEIVGVSGPHAFRYANGKMEPLGSLSGPSGSSNPLAVNNCGVIVGFSGHAFVYAGGRMKDLGSLGTGPNSYATAINNAGLIVGYSETAPQTYFNVPPPHAFVYSAGKMVDLGTLGTGESEAYGVNDLGQIVGSIGDTYSFSADPHAFIYSEGKMQDLNALVDRPLSLVLRSATAINNRGEIIGWGNNELSGVSFLLIPIGR
jgi:probable HAF family extracellular repeat protein